MKFETVSKFMRQLNNSETHASVIVSVEEKDKEFILCLKSRKN